MNEVTITIPAPQQGNLPTVIRYKLENGHWCRYFSGYTYKGYYVKDEHDWGCNDAPQWEMDALKDMATIVVT